MLYAKYKYCTEATHQVRNGQSHAEADTGVSNATMDTHQEENSNLDNIKDGQPRS
jgi:hypothetical protein